jgi:molybdate-binding protein/DNA-binding XRE family transcriptional regulator
VIPKEIALDGGVLSLFNSADDMIMSPIDTIMSNNDIQLKNDVRVYREARGWSQAELASRCGMSRAEISAIEVGRLTPSAAAALALARSFRCGVEALFHLDDAMESEFQWAWQPNTQSSRFWAARVGERTLLFPAELTEQGCIPSDGFWNGMSFQFDPDFDPARTLVLACCDPAVSLLAHVLAEAEGIRVIALMRSSRQALDLLQQGLVHAAGVHLSDASLPDGNLIAVRSRLGSGFRLARVTNWQEGIAVPRGSSIRGLPHASAVARSWIGRQPGSGARVCQDQILGSANPPRRIATSHRGVAEVVRAGLAKAGVCPRLVCEQMGLDFLSVREEAYDICFHEGTADDSRIMALLRVLRSTSFRRILSELPGYDVKHTGEVVATTAR